MLRYLKRAKLTIWSLHRISEESDPFFPPITPNLFDRLVRYATENYDVISFSELSKGRTRNDKPLLILSFDDGYRDFYEYALPILKKYGTSANHNIVNTCANTGKPIWTQRLNTIFEHCRKNAIELSFQTGTHDITLREHNGDWIKFYLSVFHEMLEMPSVDRLAWIVEKEAAYSVDTSVRMMTWDEIAECAANGIEIGSHTYSHDVLTEHSGEAMLEREVISSKLEIEQKIGRGVSVLALPNGKGSPKINQFVERAGFEFLLYVNDGVNEIQHDGAGFRVFDRINMVEEGYAEAVLRAEMFHAKLRKYV